MELPYAETGTRILKLRKEQQLTRERLAELADISVQFLADIEKGKKNMTVTTLRKLAAALGVSTEYIVNGCGDPHEQALTTVYQRLSPENRKRALDILRLFAEAVEE